MTKKRLTFDMDLPEDETFPAGKVLAAPSAPQRRGPMATAITENADALRSRQSIEADIRAENDALAMEHVRLKRLGLITALVPLDEIVMAKLTRDRALGDDPELAELVASVRDVGLSNPIRIEAAGEARYELIQGFRRLSAYRSLLAETGDAVAWGTIPAVIVPRGMTMDSLYRQMVDENMVRKDISFAEMAMMALNYARDPLTSETDPERAVAKLFKSAGYSKRSYIRGFLRLMAHLGDHLQFYHHIPRALGLKLSDELEQRDGLAAQLIAVLKGMDNRSVTEELDLLRRSVGMADAEGLMPMPAAAVARPRLAATAKTTFQIVSRLGTAKCVAANGRLDIRLDRDFTTLDRIRLEAVVRSMLDQLL